MIAMTHKETTMTTETTKLHVFHDDYEYRVAASAEDAMAQQMRDSGLPAEDCTAAEDWREIPDDMDLPYFEPAEKDGKITVTETVKKAGEWAEESGPGCIGGTEW